VRERLGMGMRVGYRWGRVCVCTGAGTYPGFDRSRHRSVRLCLCVRVGMYGCMHKDELWSGGNAGVGVVDAVVVAGCVGRSRGRAAGGAGASFVCRKTALGFMVNSRCGACWFAGDDGGEVWCGRRQGVVGVNKVWRSGRMDGGDD
jgi:hypothetical protein